MLKVGRRRSGSRLERLCGLDGAKWPTSHAQNRGQGLVATGGHK